MERGGKAEERGGQGWHRSDNDPDGHIGVVELCVEFGEGQFSEETGLNWAVGIPVHEVMECVGVEVV